MKQKTIQIDSFVEEITNSSTVIFTWANSDAVKLMKQFIKDMLDEAGIDKDVDELYDVYVTLDEGEIETIAENQMYVMENVPKYNSTEYKEKWNEIKNNVRKEVENGNLFENEENWMGFSPSTTLVVKCKKSGKELDIAGLFHHDGGRDG